MILDQLEKLATDRANHPAVVELAEGRALSFSELRRQCRQASRALDRARLPERARVIALTGNRPAFLSLLVACLEQDRVLIPMDADSTPSEVEAVARHFGAAALVSPTAGASAETLPFPGGVSLQVLERRPPADALAGVWLLKLTSGSTGLPKAVPVSVQEMVNDGRHVAEAMGIEPQDINLGLIPLSHSYGLGNLAMPLLLQGTTLALRTGFLPSRFVADVEQTRATVFPGVPFMFQHFQEQAFEGPLPRSLRLLLTAGAPIPPATVSYFKQQLGLKIHSFYGSSETGGITYDASQEESEPLSVGRPMPETSVTLRDGRVFVRGNAVSARGYLEGPRSGEGESRFTAGGFLTSDMGRFDDSGRLFLTGRVSSLVNVAGRKVDPLEIEAVLREMGEVAEARVVGVPCERRGQKILACVVPRGPGLSLVALRRHCAQKLSAYKIPHEFVILEALPVDGRGKLDWETLRSFSKRTDRSSQRPG